MGVVSLMFHVRVCFIIMPLMIFWSVQHDFVNYFTVLLFVFLSFIAKGLAICRLGGVITTQKVLFDSL